MRYVMLILGSFLAGGVASAQTFGEITGVVKDQSGAVAPGAPVSVTNTGTNATRSTNTNDAGIYSFPALIPGIYRVRVEARGFQPMVRNDIELQVQQTARIDFSLVVGQAAQAIEVSGSDQLLTTESATVGTVIGEKVINDLPLNGRNFLQLVALSPNVTFGFAPPSAANVRQGGDRSTQNISVAGMRGTWNNFTLDGVSNLDPNFNLYIQLPSVDALQEFKVQSGIYPAEFGREAAQINVSTKPGTNDFHGTVFEFLRNSEIDAKPYDFIGTSPAKAPFRWNQYGFVLGGPVWIPKLFNGRNRLFFMSNFEGFKSRRTDQALYTVPTAAWRAGDFSSFPTALFDPFTRTIGANGTVTAAVLPGNRIPANRFDPVALRLLEFLPLPNLNPSNSINPLDNYQNPQKTTIDKNQFNQRIDFNESSNSQWFGRYSWTDEFTIMPSLPLSGGALYINSRQYMASNIRVLSPTRVNEFRFGYTTIFNNLGQELGGKRDVVKELGLPFSSPNPESWGIPNVALLRNGLSTFGNNINGPFVIDDKIVQVLDNFSWNRGKHSLRFGGEYRWDVYAQYGNSHMRGLFQFNGQYTANPNTLVGGNAAADLLLGNPFRTDLALQFAEADFKANSLAFYVDDTFKVTPKLTVTMGLRWEMVQPWKDTLQNNVNFQFRGPLPATPNVDQSLHPVYVRPGSGDFYEGVNFRYNGVQVARDGRLGDRTINTDLNNFAPRFGIAYSPSSKWSIRTGFGVFFSQETGNSKFDLNRGLTARSTELPDPRGVPTLTFRNFFNPALLPLRLDPGLTWSVDPGIATPYSMMYLFNLQRLLGSGTTIEVGYTGTLSRKLQSQVNKNGPVPGITAARLRAPYPIYAAGIEDTVGWGKGNYNAFAVKLSQRFRSGLTTLVSYTWSKALDDASAIRGTTGDQYPQNPRCFHCEYAVSGFNTPVRFVTSLLYELPFGKGKSLLNRGGVLNAVVGGWQTSTIFTAQSGRPLNPIGWDAAGQVIQPDGNRINATGADPYLPSDRRSANQWFNVPAFTNVTAGNFGTAGRNSLKGPAFWGMDISALKNFRVTEKQSLQLRIEAFNGLNHVALGSPNVRWGTTTQTPAPSFGQIRDTATARGTAFDMRQMQFGLKYIF